MQNARKFMALIMSKMSDGWCYGGFTSVVFVFAQKGVVRILVRWSVLEPQSRSLTSRRR